MHRLELAKNKREENKKFLKKLKSVKNQSKVDKVIHDVHDIVFEQTDCLDCANCCKTTGPLFTTKDIERISSKLKMKQQEFINHYLHVDEDNDYVLQKLPCYFLDTENYCSIYNFRPKACREFPHTDRAKQKQLLSKTLLNAEVCPAVYEILERVKTTY